MSGLAEFSQQTILYKIIPKEEEKKNYNSSSVCHYSLLGGGIFAPVLHVWYTWLDKRLPGTAAMVVIKKTVLDIGVFAVPYYSAFYIVLNMLSGQGLHTAM